jgi:NADH-quinone oxidoreductase subunit J
MRRKDVRPMSLIFYLIAALTVAGGLAAVLLKNTVHCALALTVAFAGLALLFLNLDAQFAGFAQILVYIGAVAILVVFAILLTKGSETPQGGVFSRTWLVGLTAAAAVFAVLGWAVIASAPLLPKAATPATAATSAMVVTPAPAVPPAPAVTVEQIGRALAGRYVLALEIVAVLLTAALIGAVIVAMHEKEEAK